MSAPAPTAPRRPRPRVGAALVGAVLVGAVLVVATCAYLRLGWWRMETACTPTATSQSVTHAWSRSGFTCTYDSGRVVSSWWF